MTAEELVLLLERSVRGLGAEDRVQAKIAELLRRERVTFAREVALSKKDRIDFLVGRMGVEVKVDGSVDAVTRQLTRYAAHECIDELVLVTTKITLSRQPETLSGKRVSVAAILSGVI